MQSTRSIAGVGAFEIYVFPTSGKGRGNPWGGIASHYRDEKDEQKEHDFGRITVTVQLGNLTGSASQMPDDQLLFVFVSEMEFVPVDLSVTVKAMKLTDRISIIDLKMVSQ